MKAATTVRDELDVKVSVSVNSAGRHAITKLREPVIMKRKKTRKGKKDDKYHERKSEREVMECNDVYGERLTRWQDESSYEEGGGEVVKEESDRCGPGLYNPPASRCLRFLECRPEKQSPTRRPEPNVP